MFRHDNTRVFFWRETPFPTANIVSWVRILWTYSSIIHWGFFSYYFISVLSVVVWLQRLIVFMIIHWVPRVISWFFSSMCREHSQVFKVFAIISYPEWVSLKIKNAERFIFVLFGWKLWKKMNFLVFKFSSVHWIVFITTTKNISICSSMWLWYKLLYNQNFIQLWWRWYILRTIKHDKYSEEHERWIVDSPFHP